MGFSPSLSLRSDSAEECSDSTISSTASPVALAKKVKKMIRKMNRKAGKSHQKIIGMLGQIKEELKYLEVLVQERAASCKRGTRWGRLH